MVRSSDGQNGHTPSPRTTRASAPGGPTGNARPPTLAPLDTKKSMPQRSGSQTIHGSPNPFASSQPRQSAPGIAQPRQSAPGAAQPRQSAPGTPHAGAGPSPPLRASASGALLSSSADLPALRSSQSELPRLSHNGELPKLTGVADSADRARPVAFRRAATLTARTELADAKTVGNGVESAFAIKKDRAALQHDKAALLMMKRRLEALLTRVLEGPLAEDGLQDEESAAALWDGVTASVLAGAAVGAGKGRTGQLRTQLKKALEESAAMEKHLASGSSGVAVAAAAADAEARIKELTARMAEMQLDHEVAVSRLEGELSYRKTQASASAGGLQRQCAEQEEELRRLRQSLAQHEHSVRELSGQVGCGGAEGGAGRGRVCLRRLQQSLAQHEHSVRELSGQSASLRQQLSGMGQALAEKAQQLADVRGLLGMDKATMDTVIEMLKEQLKDANADRAAKGQRITELEYMVVHRDALLAEAEDRVNKAAAAAAAAAAHNSPPGVASAAKSAAAPSPMHAKGAWSVLAKTVAAARAIRDSGSGSARGPKAGPSQAQGLGPGDGGKAAGSGPAKAAARAAKAAKPKAARGKAAGPDSDVESYTGDAFEDEE
ncbi:hypothetical protein HYH03_013081 [Edaphochlamys debaryana]|uniref:Uncharacterized protein n=1 Tax=Edaphochlamys debaryana TaxID=47281 RepID=A0A836BTC5_9CHLO|nr:hypothetical protein HYH03_013081 [Edaphochlamys debaryana]|eukprot:KAG2488396.1 hypothetical protein HYH03_013081 [Edaphochlamys debaryana]